MNKEIKTLDLLQKAKEATTARHSLYKYSQYKKLSKGLFTETFMEGVAEAYAAELEAENKQLRERLKQADEIINAKIIERQERELWKTDEIIAQVADNAIIKELEEINRELVEAVGKIIVELFPLHTERTTSPHIVNAFEISRAAMETVTIARAAEQKGEKQ